jgi:hypothetical protein
VDEVAIGAELRVGHRASRRRERGDDPHRLGGLAHPVARVARPLAHLADADEHALAGAQLVERAAQALRVVLAGPRRQRQQRTQRLASRVAERAGLDRAQARLDALGHLGPRPPFVAGHRARLEEDLRAVEIAPGRAGARLGDVARIGCERLEEVTDEVLGGQPLDQLGLAQREDELVGDRLQQLVVLGVPGARAQRDQRAELVTVVAQHRPPLDARL